MRRLTASVILAVFFMAVTSVYVKAADLKIGYVDLSRAFDEYEKTKEYDKVLSEKQKTFESELNKRGSEVTQLQDKMAVLSDKEKEKKQSEIEGKIKLYEDYRRTAGEDLRKERDERIKDILKDIEKSIKEVAQKEGYDLVLNDRVLVYDNKDNKSLDLTDKVIQAVNSAYKKK